MPMEYSKTGEALTKRFESCRLNSYRVTYPGRQDVWTIGWGTTGPDIVEGLVWTQEKADAELDIRLAKAEDCVNRCVTVALTQGEFDALVDFDYNAGNAGLEGSTLLRLLNAGNYAGAAAEFDKWDHVGGLVVSGLLRRREAETQEFLGV